MSRFRPNIVATNVAEPWSEDRWKVMRINELELHGVAACSRCKMTTINANSCTMSDEPLKTLQTFRRSLSPESSVRRPSYGLMFGTNLIHRMPSGSSELAPAAEVGRISVGDAIVVETWGEALEHVPQAVSATNNT
jgi:uncharacterized protein YcbX